MIKNNTFLFLKHVTEWGEVDLLLLLSFESPEICP